MFSDPDPQAETDGSCDFCSLKGEGGVEVN